MTQEPDIKAQVRATIVDHLGLDASDIQPDDDLEHRFKADSLDWIEIIMALEEKFYIEISDVEAESARTVSDAVEIVTRLTTPTERAMSKED